MKSSVVIKGCKSGMTVILNPDTPFEQLLEDVGKKFKESEKFWGSAQMTLTLEGRELTPIEELQVTDAITANSQIEILCLLDTDANRIARCEKALTERLMELTKSSPSMPESTSSTGWATCDSMISGLAPGYMTLTVTIGTSMLGYSRTARRW